MRGKKLSTVFYLQEDVVKIAQELLGTLLCTYIDHKFTSGIIVETEAYQGPEDAASHAYNSRRTTRTEVMFLEGGKSYVYLIYGIYKLFNIVTAKQGIPHAVLIRAIEPKEGLDIMKKRRAITTTKKNISSGPGLLTQALGINLIHNKLSLNGPLIWLEEKKDKLPKEAIIASTRIGLNHVKEPYKSIHWRFYIKDNSFASYPCK